LPRSSSSPAKRPSYWVLALAAIFLPARVGAVGVHRARRGAAGPARLRSLRCHRSRWGTCSV
jgi:hypothetical protein